MTQSREEQIIDNLITTLEGMKPPTYNYKLYKVSRFTTVHQVKFTKFPSVDVVIDRIEKTDEEDHGVQDCIMRIILGVYVDDKVNPGQVLSTVCADIEKILNVDIYRGALALKTSIVSIDYEYVDADPLGITGDATMDIEIEYEHDRADPFSAP